MHKLTLAVVAAALLAAGPPARAGDDYETLEQAYRDAQQKWFEQIRDTEPEKRPPHPATEFMPKFRAYAEQHAGRPEAVKALGWMVGAAGMTGSDDGKPGPDVKWALERLRTDHAADPGIQAVLSSLRYSAYYVGQEPLVALYEKVMAANPDKEAQATAVFNLACLHYEQPAPSGPDKDKESATARKRAEELFRKAVRDYPGTKAARNAEGYIYEIEHLQIGMKAPEIIGTDADEKELRLSQFKGQVVVLDFWGFW